MIDNGAAPAGLVSTSATAPTLPSGYTYLCRLGAMRVDGSGNLLRTIQLGSQTQYSPQATGNTTTFPVILSGGTLITLWTATSLANFVPPTATQLVSTIGINIDSSSGVFAVAANGNAPLITGGIYYNNQAAVINQDLRVPVSMVLETSPGAVVLSPGQFEPWQTRTHELLSYSPQSAPYARAAQIFDGVTRGDIPDPTNGATHFLNPEIVRMRRGGSLPGNG